MQTGSDANLETTSGATQVRAVQLGFPAELTSSWDATTGYSWKRRALAGVTVSDPSFQATGNLAATPDNNTSLTAGTQGWMEPDPGRRGYIFNPTAGASSTSTSATGCGWIAGMSEDCVMSVSVSGVTVEDLFLVADEGGTTWDSSPDTVTICDVSYTVTVSRVPGGLPTVTLTYSDGSGGETVFQGDPDGCNCPTACWVFALSDLCPDAPPSANPCENVIRICVEGFCPAWYCVADTETDPDATCDAGPRAVVFVAAGEDTSGLIICSGPHKYRVDAFDECVAHTCEEAELGGIEVAVGDTYEADYPPRESMDTGGTEHWIKFPITADGLYHVTITFTGINDIVPPSYTAANYALCSGSCACPVTSVVYEDQTVCTSQYGLAGGAIYLRVSATYNPSAPAVGAGTFTYTVILESGACP